MSPKSVLSDRYYSTLILHRRLIRRQDNFISFPNADKSNRVSLKFQSNGVDNLLQVNKLSDEFDINVMILLLL